MTDRDDWFTVERIDGETFAISEYGHWEQAHSYLFIGGEKAALIDTGLGIGNIRKVTDRLTDKPVTVLTTHVHWDHIGGHGLFQDIQVHASDREWLENGLPLPLKAVRAQLMKSPLTCRPPDSFNPDTYTVFKGAPTGLLRDGERIELGGRTLRILHTPGHSPGHVCVYDASRAFLATGDLLYYGTLYASYPSTDPKAFAASIFRLAELGDVKKLLPGHNGLELPPDMLSKAKEAFGDLGNKDMLHHGSGHHRFEYFSVQF